MSPAPIPSAPPLPSWTDRYRLRSAAESPAASLFPPKARSRRRSAPLCGAQKNQKDYGSPLSHPQLCRLPSRRYPRWQIPPAAYQASAPPPGSARYRLISEPRSAPRRRFHYSKAACPSSLRPSLRAPEAAPPHSHFGYDSFYCPEYISCYCHKQLSRGSQNRVSPAHHSRCPPQRQYFFPAYSGKAHNISAFSAAVRSSSPFPSADQIFSDRFPPARISAAPYRKKRPAPSLPQTASPVPDPPV